MDPYEKLYEMLSDWIQDGLNSEDSAKLMADYILDRLLNIYTDLLEDAIQQVRED